MVAELHDEHSLVLVDRRPRKGYQTVRADVSRSPGGNTRRRRGWRRYDWAHVMEGADAVLHLAGDPSPRASWDSAMTSNAGATWNVLEAACRHGVPRVVLASSNRVMRAAIEERKQTAGAPANATDQYRPLSPYGVSKATAELAGRMFVERGLLQAFIAVRIGALGGPRPKETAPDRLTVDPADLRGILRQSLEGSITGYHVVYGVSPDHQPLIDMEPTMRLLPWNPPWWSLRAG